MPGSPIIVEAGPSASRLQAAINKKSTTADFVKRLTGAATAQATGGLQADGINPDGTPHYDGSQSAINALLAQANQPAQKAPAPLPQIYGSTTSAEGPGALAGAAAAAGAAGSTDPAVAFAAMLKLARKESGGKFNSKPFERAIAADEAAAASQRTNAENLGARAEGDDAVLYGRLNNYVKMLQGAGRQDTRQTIRGVTGDYNRALGTIGDTFNQNRSANNAELARMGLAPESGGSQGFETGRALSGRADARSDARLSGDAFDRLMGQTRADVVTTGTGKVADEKAAMNTALENIASQLSGQEAGVNSSEASARSNYQASIRSLAQSLLGQQAASNPNSLDNMTKAAKLAQTEAETKMLLQKLGGTAGGALDLSGKKGYGNAIDTLANEAKLGVSGGGIDPTHLGTLETFLSDIEAGGNGPVSFPKIAGPFVFNSANLGTALAEANALIKKADIAKGYGATDQNALATAIRMLLGQE